MRALITGGTSGIGYCIAEELIKKGYDVMIVFAKKVTYRN